MLKKFIAIILLFQIASNNALAEEVIKLPGLISHYIHHSTEHNDKEGFFEFLHQHYSDFHLLDRHADSKHEEDKDCNLPFKHCDGCCVSFHSGAPGFVSAYLTADCNIIPVESINFSPEQDSFQSFDLSNIWQPPKIS